MNSTHYWEPLLRGTALLVLAGATSAGAADALILPITQPDKNTAAGVSVAPRVSADGRWVVFSSEAGDLVPDDRNGVADVFVRDRQTGTTLLVSRRAGGGTSGNRSSSAPALTPDGRYVVFQSTATDLVPAAWVPPGASSARSLIYRYDRVTGEMRLINVNRPEPVPNPLLLPPLTNSTRELVAPIISDDGQRVLFSVGRNRSGFSAAGNPPGFGEAAQPDALFLWSAANGFTEHISERFQTAPVPDGAVYLGAQTDNPPLMSANGRFVAFAQAAQSLALGTGVVSFARMNVIVRDRIGGTNIVPNWINSGVALTNGSGWWSLLAGMSADGQHLLYERRGLTLLGDATNDSPANQPQLWLQHLTTGEFLCVSSNTATGELGGMASTRGAISANGNWVAYFSKAPNLAGGDPNAMMDVFLYGRTNGVTTRISTHPAWVGTPAGRADTAPVLTPNGRYALYQVSGTGLFRYDRGAGTNALITTDVATDASDISADGRFVVFTALPASLDPADRNPYRQVYCHDFETGQTELMSTRDPAVPAATPSGATSLELAAVSATGRFVAFTGYAPDLVAGASRLGRLWVRDTQLGTNILVSVDKDGQPLAGPDVFRNVQLSADGRWVCFVSRSAALVTGDTNNQDDVFVRDLLAGSTKLVSRNAAGTGTAAGLSHSPVLARDGSKVVFKSWAVDVASPGGFNDLFVHSMASGTNALATSAVSVFSGANGPCDGAVLSPDGRWLLFRSRASNITPEYCVGFSGNLVLRDLSGPGPAHCISFLVPGQPLPGSLPGSWAFSRDSQWLVFNHWDANFSDVYRRSVTSGPLELVTTNGFRPFIANGGAVIAWQTRVPLADYADTNKNWDVIHHQLADAVTRVISLDQTGTQTGNGASRLIGLSPDGRYVLFTSHASNLVAGDANVSLDLFLRDTLTGVTQLLSRKAVGTGTADGYSAKATFTEDGSQVIFESYASDLAANDFNLERDIFVAQLTWPDSDNDGLPDDWELTYFGNLAPNGGDDPDGDGQSNAAEFAAGTSPINSASILRVTTVTGIGSGTTTILWSSVPGRTYRVQYRDDFNTAGWSNFTGTVTSTSSSALAVDPLPADPHRFYRVLLVE